MAGALLVSFLMFAAWLTVLRAEGERLLSVQSASMAPVFQPGDALLIKPVEATQLHVGDIISYHSSVNPRLIISHRLVGISFRHDRLVTAGDVTGFKDAPITASTVDGRVSAIAPHLGHVLDGLQHPILLSVLVGVPAAVVLQTEFTRLSRHFRQPLYRARGYSRESGGV